MPTRCWSIGGWTSGPPNPHPRSGTASGHHLIDILDVRQTATVAEFQRLARAAIEDCRGRGVVPIVVGGSALYVRAIVDDFEFPGTDPALRARLEQRAGHGRTRDAAPATRRGRPGRRRADPARERAPDRPGAGGGRAHRPAVTADPAGAPLPCCRTWSRSDSTSTGPPSTPGSPPGSTRCGRPDWSSRLTPWPLPGCARDAPRPGPSATGRCWSSWTATCTEQEAKDARRWPALAVSPDARTPGSARTRGSTGCVGMRRTWSTARSRCAGRRGSRPNARLSAMRRWSFSQGARHPERLRAAAGPGGDARSSARPRSGSSATGTPGSARTACSGQCPPSTSTSWDGDGSLWFMDYRNADGSLAEMCGNGVRVFVRFLLDQDLATGTDGAGRDPGRAAARRRVLPDGRYPGRDGPGHRRPASGRRSPPSTARHVCRDPADVGNPHAVSFVDELDQLPLHAGADLEPRSSGSRTGSTWSSSVRSGRGTWPCGCTSGGPARPGPAAPVRSPRPRWPGPHRTA